MVLSNEKDNNNNTAIYRTVCFTTFRKHAEQACIRRQQLRPRCLHLANSTKRNVVLDFGPLAPLCENVTLSTKPEVHT